METLLAARQENAAHPSVQVLSVGRGMTDVWAGARLAAFSRPVDRRVTPRALRANHAGGSRDLPAAARPSRPAPRLPRAHEALGDPLLGKHHMPCLLDCSFLIPSVYLITIVRHSNTLKCLLDLQA